MAQQKETNWIAKEQRELFCKSVNSMIMTFNNLDDMKKYIEYSKAVVDKAFFFYPDTIETDDIYIPEK